MNNKNKEEGLMELSISLSVMTNPFCLDDFTGSDWHEAIRNCADAGYLVLDWNACDCVSQIIFQENHIPDQKQWNTFITEMRWQAERLNVRFNQAHGLMFNYFRKDTKTLFLHWLEEQILLACAELGIQWIVYHPVAPDEYSAAQNIQGCKRANQEYLSRIAEKAGKLGLGIALENMIITRNSDGTLFWRYCAAPEELVDLVDSIDMENVKICMDVGHAHIMNPYIPETLALFGNRTAALHIHDNDRINDQHLVPFQGIVDWELFMQTLANSGYTGDFTFEIHPFNVIQDKNPLCFPDAQTELLRNSYQTGQYLLERYQYHKNIVHKK